MPTVKNSITLQDKFTPVLGSIIKSMKSTMKVMESMDKAANKGATSKAFKAAQKDIAAAENALTKFNNGMDELGSLTNKAEKGFTIFRGAVANFAGDMITRAIDGAKNSIGEAFKTASDLTEVQNVVDVTYGKSAAAIDKWAETTLNAYGLNKLSAKQYAGSMGAMLKSSGLAGDEVMKMSTSLAELSGDMASFYNLSNEEAWEKIRSGISGETEPLKVLGINMSVANMEAYALSKGITKTWESMSQAEQTQLRYAYLMKVTSDAQGDFTRTSDSYANQQKLLTENWKIFTAGLVVGLLPTLSKLMQWLNQLIGKMSEWGAWIGDFVSTHQPAIIGALIAIGIIVGVTLVQRYGAMMLAAIKSGAASVGAAIKSAAAWIAANWPLLLIAASIGVLIALWNNLGQVGQAVGILIAIICGIVAMAVMGVSWPIIAIIAILAVVASGFVFFGNIAAEVCGYIGGVIGGLAVFFENIFIGWYNIVAAFVNFFGNVFNDPIYTIKKLFVDLANSVIGIVKKIAEAIDFVLGTNLAGGLSNMQNNMLEWLGTSEKYKDIMTPKEYKSIVEGVGAGYDTGKKIGAGIADAAQGLAGKAKGLLGGGAGAGASNAAAIAGASGGDPLQEGGKVSEVGKIGSDVSITDEDIKMLRDIARIDYVNKFTTLQPKMQVTFGDVRETADTKKIMTVLEDMWEEARASALA